MIERMPHYDHNGAASAGVPDLTNGDGPDIAIGLVSAKLPTGQHIKRVRKASADESIEQAIDAFKRLFTAVRGRLDALVGLFAWAICVAARQTHGAHAPAHRAPAPRLDAKHQLSGAALG
jgi:hypothetical protein